MRKRDLFAWMAAMGVLFALSFSPDRFLHRSPLVDDEASYFSHAMTIGLDFDLDYANEIGTRFNCDGTALSHPIGAGLMAAPFVALFGTLDRAAGHPIIHDHRRYRNSWSFFGFIFSANVYFLFGIWFYYGAFLEIFKTVRISHVILYVASTGIVHYVLYAFFMSHAFEFATLAFSTWSAARLYTALKREKGSLLWLAVCAVSVVLNLLVRYANVNVALLPMAMVLLARIRDLDERRPDGGELAALAVKQAAFLAVGFIPAALLFQWMYGGLYPTPGVTYCLEMDGLASNNMAGLTAKVMGLLPNLPLLVFGSELGLLFSNPCIVFGFVFITVFLIGAFVQRDTKMLVSWAILLVWVYYAFDVGLVLLWKTTATAYGYRYLFPLVPFGLWGLALWDETRMCAGCGPKRPRVVAMAAATVIIYALCAFSILSQVFTDTTEELSPKAQVNIFGEMHERSYNGYSMRLLRELSRPGTWVSLVTNRYPGFQGGYFIAHTRVGKYAPEALKEKYRKVYADVAPCVYVQAFVLLVLWVASGAWFFALQRKGYAGPAHRKVLSPLPGRD